MKLVPSITLPHHRDVTIKRRLPCLLSAPPTPRFKISVRIREARLVNRSKDSHQPAVTSQRRPEHRPQRYKYKNFAAGPKPLHQRAVNKHEQEIQGLPDTTVKGQDSNPKGLSWLTGSNKPLPFSYRSNPCLSSTPTIWLWFPRTTSPSRKTPLVPPSNACPPACASTAPRTTLLVRLLPTASRRI